MATKQKSGLYRSKVKIGVDAAGKDIFKYISGKTKRELEEQRQKVIARYIDCTALIEDRLFGEYVVEWFKVRKSPGLSDSSRESYRTALNKHILPIFGDRKLRSIRPIELQDFLNGFAGASQTKITYIAAALDGVFSSACVDCIIAQNPMANIIKPGASPAIEKRALTPEERKIVVRTCTSHPNGAYLAGMYYLGVRPGENRGLQWGDFDWTSQRVHIQRDIDYKNHGQPGDLKNKGSDRWIPVPDPLHKILYPLRGKPDQYVFHGERSGQALAKTTAERMWISLMMDCGLAEPRPAGSTHYRPTDLRAMYKPLITAHTLRHNYIVMCWEAGVDVYTAMRLVGHSNINTIMGIYMHLTEQMMSTAQAQLDDLFQGNPKKESCTKVAQHVPHIFRV